MTKKRRVEGGDVLGSLGKRKGENGRWKGDGEMMGHGGMEGTRTRGVTEKAHAREVSEDRVDLEYPILLV